MPGALDSVLRPVAEKLIEQFGGPATYRVVSESFSATTGVVTATETAYSVIMTPPEPFIQARYAAGLGAEAAVQVGDMRALVKGQNLGFTPSLGDRVTYTGTDWQVVGVTPLYSGALPAAYELRLRQ